MNNSPRELLTKLIRTCDLTHGKTEQQRFVRYSIAGELMHLLQDINPLILAGWTERQSELTK